MTQRRLTEFTEYISPDGQVYPFHVPSHIGRWLISDSGWGMPPIEHVTQRGPFQHGESVVDYFLRPRTIQLLIRQTFCDRSEYWSGRADLLDAIRPNRQTAIGNLAAGSLRKRTAAGDLRQVDVFIAQGPLFEPRQVGRWDEFAFQEVLRFVAYNPVEYDPARQSMTFSQAEAQLVFPITFPITFGAFGGSQNLTYLGTWLEYPTIEVTGPISGFQIINQTTDEQITFTTTIAAGETVTFNLLYGTKTVTRNDGTNMIGGVDPASDLGTFHLEPAPVAANGVNQLQVLGSGTTAATSIVLRYYNRYIGI